MYSDPLYGQHQFDGIFMARAARTKRRFASLPIVLIYPRVVAGAWAASAAPLTGFSP